MKLQDSLHPVKHKSEKRLKNSLENKGISTSSVSCEVHSKPQVFGGSKGLDSFLMFFSNLSRKKCYSDVQIAHETIARNIGLSDRQVRRLIKLAIIAGLLVCTENNQLKRKSNKYQLTTKAIGIYKSSYDHKLVHKLKGTYKVIYHSKEKCPPKNIKKTNFISSLNNRSLFKNNFNVKQENEQEIARRNLRSRSYNKSDDSFRKIPTNFIKRMPEPRAYKPQITTARANDDLKNIYKQTLLDLHAGKSSIQDIQLIIDHGIKDEKHKSSYIAALVKFKADLKAVEDFLREDRL